MGKIPTVSSVQLTLQQYLENEIETLPFSLEIFTPSEKNGSVQTTIQPERSTTSRKQQFRIAAGRERFQCCGAVRSLH